MSNRWSTPRETVACMSPLDAARHTCEDAPGGLPAMALLLGKSPDTLRKELAGVAGYKLGLVDAVRILTRTRDLRIADSVEAEVDRFALPLPQLASALPDEALTSHLVQLSKEFADVLQEVAGRAADGDISDRDLRAVEEQWGELVAAGGQLMRHLTALNQAKKPSMDGGAA